MNSERTALLAIVTVALLAALIAAPAVAGEITANDTPADDEILTMATAGDTPPLPNAAPGLAVAEGAVTITAAGTSVPAFAAGVGSDEGWYRIQCNVDGANVYFDGQYMGITSGGQLYVPVYTTGSPYSTIRIEKSGYHTYTASLPSGPAAGETREVYVTLQPVAPGDTVTTVSVSGVPDNASFSLTIRNVFATTPGEAFEFTIRDLSLPFSLNSGEVNAYTRGTDWTELVAALPDGGSVIMRINSDDNGEVRIAQPRDIPSGTFVPITFQGKAAASSLVADFTILGTKQGPDDGQISFTIEGIEQGTMTGSVYVDGSEVLSWGGSSGGGAPMPTPTPMWTPTPSQTPAVPRDLGITSNKDTVVRGNAFIVTITGDSGQDYFLTIQNPGAQPPTFRVAQVGVTPTADPNNVTVRTTAAGTRSVELNTSTATREASYTLRVTDSRDASKYEEVHVRVETGAVTITASGTGTYYLGDEITLSGTNTDSDATYLFLTGPNLPVNGVRLEGGMSPVESSNATSFTSTSVAADEIWVYRWDTSSITRRLDSGGYTIYAVAEPQGKNNLAGTKYDTQTIQLRPGSLCVDAPGTTLVRGDEYRVGGIATGNPPSVNVWIFGPNYYGGVNGALAVRSVAVEPDGTFECIFTGAETGALQDGRYYVIVQHPAGAMFEVAQGTGAQDVNTIYRADQSGTTNVFVARLTSLKPAEAASALIDALESPYVDDVYIKFSFTIDEFWVWIDGIADQTYGETFTVTGTTGYPAGTVLDFWIATEDDNTFVLSGEAVVADGGDWSIDLDTTAIGSGGFILRITAPDGQASASAIFDVYDDVTHPLPPGGGSYRVERMGTTPSLDSLSAGEGVALDGIIRLDGTLGYPYSSRASRILEFSTDLQNPVWSYNLRVDGNLLYTAPLAVNSRSFMLSGWDLDYLGDVRILLYLSGTVPQGAENAALLRILEREGDGRVVPNSEHRLSIPLSDDPAPLSVDNLTLSPGWNFVSIPRLLAAGSDTAAIFEGVVSDGHSALRFDTAAGDWIALQKPDRLAPLEGYWIYSAGPATVPLNFSTDPLISPAERALAAGWNAVGITGSTPATARDAFHSVKGQWSNLIGYNAGAQTFETGIVNGGSGPNADTRPVYPGRGYWLSMTGPGTLYAIGA
jgi:hypothetical protein